MPNFSSLKDLASKREIKALWKRGVEKSNGTLQYLSWLKTQPSIKPTEDKLSLSSKPKAESLPTQDSTVHSWTPSPGMHNISHQKPDTLPTEQEAASLSHSTPTEQPQRTPAGYSDDAWEKFKRMPKRKPLPTEEESLQERLNIYRTWDEALNLNPVEQAKNPLKEASTLAKGESGHTNTLTLSDLRGSPPLQKIENPHFSKHPPEEVQNLGSNRAFPSLHAPVPTRRSSLKAEIVCDDDSSVSSLRNSLDPSIKNSQGNRVSQASLSLAPDASVAASKKAVAETDSPPELTAFLTNSRRNSQRRLSQDSTDSQESLSLGRLFAEASSQEKVNLPSNSRLSRSSFNNSNMSSTTSFATALERPTSQTSSYYDAPERLTSEADLLQNSGRPFSQASQSSYRDVKANVPPRLASTLMTQDNLYQESTTMAKNAQTAKPARVWQNVTTVLPPRHNETGRILRSKFSDDSLRGNASEKNGFEQFGDNIANVISSLSQHLGISKHINAIRSLIQSQ